MAASSVSSSKRIFIETAETQDQPEGLVTQIPHDVLKIIFSTLSVETLARVAEVSKFWKAVSDSHDVWKIFSLRMGLFPNPQLNPRVDYGRVKAALLLDHVTEVDFPNGCSAVVRFQENVFLNYGGGITVLNLRTKQLTNLGRRDIYRRVEIVSNFLIEILQTTPVRCNIYSAETLKPLFFWDQTFNFETYTDLEGDLGIHLILDDGKNIIHAVDADHNGQPAIYIRNKEIAINGESCKIVTILPHPHPIIFFRKKNGKLITLDTKSQIRVWDLKSEGSSRLISLQFPEGLPADYSRMRLINENGVFILMEDFLDVANMVLRLSDITLNEDDIYLSFEVNENTWVARFDGHGEFKDFFSGKLVFISQDQRYQAIQANARGIFSIGNVHDLDAKYLKIIGSLGFVRRDLYDLNNGTLLEKEIVGYSQFGNRVQYLHDDRIIERDIFSGAITAVFAKSDINKNEDPQKGVSPLILQDATLPRPQSQIDPESKKELNGKGFKIEITGYTARIFGGQGKIALVEIQVLDPENDIQIYGKDKDVAILDSQGGLHLITAGNYSRFGEQVKRINTYDSQLIAETQKYLAVFTRGLSNEAIPIEKHLPVCTFSQGNLYLATDEKLEMWNLRSQNFCSFDRLLKFPVLELLVKDHLMFEIFVSKRDSFPQNDGGDLSDLGIIIWDLETQKHLSVIPTIARYVILSEVIVTWDVLNIMKVWSFKGKLLMEIDPSIDHAAGEDAELEKVVFYALGKDLILSEGSWSHNSHYTIDSQTAFKIQFPDPETLDNVVTDRN